MIHWILFETNFTPIGSGVPVAKLRLWCDLKEKELEILDKSLKKPVKNQPKQKS
jgi:hypothetical protein